MRHDWRGVPINLGDKVMHVAVYGSSAHFELGIVTAFTEQRVVVDHGDGHGHYCYPHRLTVYRELPEVPIE